MGHSFCIVGLFASLPNLLFNEGIFCDTGLPLRVLSLHTTVETADLELCSAMSLVGQIETKPQHIRGAWPERTQIALLSKPAG